MIFFAVFAAILAVGVAFPNSWTLQDLDAALSNPNTDPAMVPYLEAALNDLIAAIHAGQDVESILVPVPGLVPTPELPALKPEPAFPEPEVKPPTSAAFAGPLVQVIVNVNKKLQQSTEVPMPEPAIVPSPVLVVDNDKPVGPSPVVVVDNDKPEPIEILPAPAPVPVNPGFNPIDVIAINPEPVGVLEVNPAGDGFGPLV